MSIDRRQFLTIGAGFVAGAVGGIVAEEVYIKPKGPEQLHLPDNAVGHFKIGSTTFAFEPEWQQDSRDKIRKTIEEVYWPMAEIFGAEPGDAANIENANIFIVSGKLPENILGRADSVHGTKRKNILLPDTNEFTIAHELAHAFFLTNSIGAFGQPQYWVLNEGMADSVAAKLGKAGKDLETLHVQIKTKPFAFIDVNKRQAASYGEYSQSTLIRRVLAANALLDALDQDPDLFKKFRREYLNIFQKAPQVQTGLTIERIRKAFSDSFLGDFKALQEKHKILGPALPGKHILITPFRSDDLEQEVLGAVIFDRDQAGFIETPLEGVALNVKIVVDGRDFKATQQKTTRFGLIALITRDQLELPQFKGKKLTYTVQSDFGSDEVSFVA